jgi:hypothetical protein
MPALGRRQSAASVNIHAVGALNSRSVTKMSGNDDLKDPGSCICTVLSGDV